jgi:hypothetical protein
MSYSRRTRGGGEEEQQYTQSYGNEQEYYQPQEVQANEVQNGPKPPRAALYQKTDAQIRILNQWWKSRTRRGTIDRTLCSTAEKQKLADKTGLPMKIVRTSHEERTWLPCHIPKPLRLED